MPGGARFPLCATRPKTDPGEIQEIALPWTATADTNRPKCSTHDLSNLFWIRAFKYTFYDTQSIGVKYPFPFYATIIILIITFRTTTHPILFSPILLILRLTSFLIFYVSLTFYFYFFFFAIFKVYYLRFSLYGGWVGCVALRCVFLSQLLTAVD